ncbi:MAG: hypothetical protein F6K24_20335 [Okeania sp. SIO2D1]|nr:hypothetical protein [Okeania sp. SIO2D1]
MTNIYYNGGRKIFRSWFMLEKFFYATMITLLLPILLGISPFSKPQSLNFKEITWKSNYIQNISPEPEV